MRYARFTFTELMDMEPRERVFWLERLSEIMKDESTPTEDS